MQVFKAWSSSFGVCEGPAEVVVPPVLINLRPRPARPPRTPPPRPPNAPCPMAPEQAQVKTRPVASASPAETARWLRSAVALAIVGRELGSEGLASVLAARLDDRQAAALKGLRDSGQLEVTIGDALVAQAMETRADVPLERIVRAAVRRYELREWLPLVRRG